MSLFFVAPTWDLTWLSLLFLALFCQQPFFKDSCPVFPSLVHKSFNFLHYTAVLIECKTERGQELKGEECVTLKMHRGVPRLQKFWKWTRHIISGLVKTYFEPDFSDFSDRKRSGKHKLFSSLTIVIGDFWPFWMDLQVLLRQRTIWRLGPKKWGEKLPDLQALLKRALED